MQSADILHEVIFFFIIIKKSMKSDLIFMFEVGFILDLY
jgi:hypothetical protein